MYIVSKIPNPCGSYPAVQTWNKDTPPEGYAVIPDTFDTSDFYTYNGFVILTVEDLDGVDTVIGCEPNVQAHEAWKASLAETEKTAKTASRMDVLEAQATYTAMMTDTLLE